jgi:hypothetical protein
MFLTIQLRHHLCREKIITKQNTGTGTPYFPLFIDFCLTSAG